MVDNWIDCPHCGRNVVAYPEECSACGKDTRFLPDGKANPGRINQGLRSFQLGGCFTKWWLGLIIGLFALEYFAEGVIHLWNRAF